MHFKQVLFFLIFFTWELPNFLKSQNLKKESQGDKEGGQNNRKESLNIVIVFYDVGKKKEKWMRERERKEGRKANKN